MLEWYEAYADYRDRMARIEELVERVARELLGTTTVAFRGHEIDLARSLAPYAVHRVAGCAGASGPADAGGAPCTAGRARGRHRCGPGLAAEQ